MLKWSKLHSLSDFMHAPKMEGVYLIGIYTGNLCLSTASDVVSDSYMGHNLPGNFEARYVGRAFRTTLYQRIKDHYEKSSNRHIREFLLGEQRHQLAFTVATFAGEDGPEIAAQMEHLILVGANPAWNVKKTEGKTFRNAMMAMLNREPVDPRLEEFSQWYDPRFG